MTYRRSMVFVLFSVLPALAGCGLTISTPADDEETPPDGVTDSSRLLETDWLDEHLGDSKLIVIDARPTADYLEGHIPGAISASFSEAEATSRGYNVSYGCGLDFFLDADNDIPFQDGPPEQIQAAVRGFGVDQDDTVVVYDNGASIQAGRFFWTLTQHGFEDIYILDGGLGKWEADGYTVTQEIPVSTEGDFVAAEPDLSQVATTDDVLASLSDPNTVLVSSLPWAWHYGSYIGYTVPGHIPGTRVVPLAEFFNADGTWKSSEDVQATLDVVGITPDKSIITYCGGGPLSGCMYFTFRYVLGYPEVRNYTGSYLDWITDSRDLSVDLYDHEHWLRDTAWLRWWVGERMQTLVPVSPALAVDVRASSDYQAGHIPWSVNVPMHDSEQVVSTSTSAWAESLGDHGVGNDLEVVIVDETLTPSTTLLFWLLEYLGHDSISIASEGLAGWRAAGHPVSTEDTVIADPITPIDVAIHPTTFIEAVQPELRLSAPDEPSDHPFSRVWVVSAEQVPADVPVHTYRHIPWTENLTDDGQLEAAGTLWALYEEAEVPYFSEIICYSDDPAEATMTYFTLRILGFPRVAVYLP